MAASGEHKEPKQNPDDFSLERDFKNPDEYFAAFIKALHVDPEELKTSFLAGDPIGDSKIYNYFFSYPKENAEIATMAILSRRNILETWRNQLETNPELTPREKQLLWIVKDLAIRFADPEIKAESKDSLSQSRPPEVIDLSNPGKERLKLGDPYALFEQADWRKEFSLVPSLSLYSPPITAGYFLLSIKAGFPEGLTSLGELLRSINFPGSMRIDALCCRYDLEYFSDRRIDDPGVPDYSLSEKRKIFKLLYLLQDALKFTSPSNQLIMRDGFHPTANSLSDQFEMQRDIFYHTAVILLLDQQRYLKIMINRISDATKIIEMGPRMNKDEANKIFATITKELTIFARHYSTWFIQMLSKEPERLKPKILSLLRPDIAQQIRAESIASYVTTILTETKFPTQLGRIFSEYLADKESNIEAIFQGVSRIKDVKEAPKKTLTETKSLDDAKKQLTIAHQKILSLCNKMHKPEEVKPDGTFMLGKFMQWLEVAEVYLTLFYESKKPHSFIGTLFQGAAAQYDLEDLKNCQAVVSSSMVEAATLLDTKPESLTLSQLATLLLPLTGKSVRPDDLLKSQINELDRAVTRASAEVKASAETKTPSPDEKKSATWEAKLELELERLLERVIKVKDSLYAEELFPEVYKWFEYAATFVRLKYNEIKSSGDAKDIPAIDAFKRKIYEEYRKITVYTTNPDKITGLQLMKDKLTELVKDPDCPEFLKNQINQVITIITPHLPPPAASSAARPS